MHPARLVAQRGVVALMAVLFLLFMLGVVLVIAHQMAATDVHDSGAQNLSVEAMFLAESGLERARRRFFDGTACTALGVDGPHNLGQGSFTVNSGATTDFDGITVLPVNQCRVQVTGRITATNVARTIEGIIQMGVKVQKGFFQKNGANGNQTITGVGFQPRAVIFFWTRQTATGYVANESMGFGFASAAANQRSVAIISDDNAGTSDFKRNRSAADVIMVLVPNLGGGATLTNGARASFTSFNADGFQINWGDNDGRADIIHYIALGGDITNASVGSFNARTSAGNTAVTGVGFQPDVVLFLNSTIIATASEADRTVYNGKQFNLGMMNSAGQQWAISACGRDGQNNQAHSRGQQRTDQVIVTLANDCATADSAASYSSMNADGFTVNWSNGASAAFPIFYLALRGGLHQLGSFDQATTAGNQQTAGVGFQPDGLFLASFGRVTSVAIAADSEVSIGAASGTAARGAIWSESINLQLGPPVNANTEANTATLTDRIIRMATGPATTHTDANLTSFDSNGFTLNWTAADVTARQILYWAVGSGVPVIRWRELP